ncbi:MAG: TspO/MBR family protein [Pseudomonadota bacterium]
MGWALRNPVVVAILAALIVAIIGGAVTDVGPWYRNLEKPSFNPPDWLFAPAWTVIYALAVIAAVTGWRRTRTSAERALLISLFFVNAVLNVLWSALFFTVKRPDWALAEVATLWLSVLALIVFFLRFSKISALALAPYLLWVAFAGYLNLAIVKLNGPFG